MLFNYISLPVFLISFAIGIFLTYILTSENKIVYVYPSPENIDKVLFMDKAENCFYFEQEEIECPKDNNLLGKLPIQT
jgi:hypothetical protein